MLKGLAVKPKQENILKQDDGKITKAKKLPAMRLTDTLIDKLQNYFGIALRSRVTSVPELQNTLLASFFHTAYSKEYDYHTYCPKTVNSWFQYQRDIMNKTNLYKPGPGIASDVIKEV